MTLAITTGRLYFELVFGDDQVVSVLTTKLLESVTHPPSTVKPQLVQRSDAAGSREHGKPPGHNDTGHDYIGHNHVGHTCVRNNYAGHNYLRHNYIGQKYAGHNYICHNYRGHKY